MQWLKTILLAIQTLLPFVSKTAKAKSLPKPNPSPPTAPTIPEALEEPELPRPAPVTIQPPADPIPWLTFAKGKLGVREVPGKKADPFIVECLQTTSLPARAAESDETAWCSAFVNKCMLVGGHLGTGSAAARSWLKWGIELDLPKVGCVAVFSRGSNPAHGHVGFFMGFDSAGNVLVLGGNQRNSVSIATYPKKRVLGYRWPARG